LDSFRQISSNDGIGCSRLSLSNQNHASDRSSVRLAYWFIRSRVNFTRSGWRLRYAIYNPTEVTVAPTVVVIVAAMMGSPSMLGYLTRFRDLREPSCLTYPRLKPWTPRRRSRRQASFLFAFISVHSRTKIFRPYRRSLISTPNDRSLRYRCVRSIPASLAILLTLPTCFSSW